MPARWKPRLKFVLETSLFLFRTVRQAYGWAPRECNMCGHKGKFLAHGLPVRIDSRCPKCGSLDRHRLIRLADEAFDLFAGRDVLHFAPEPAVRAYIESRSPRRYVSADLFRTADIILDVTRIDLPDDSFEVAILSHVLEHVDDLKALRELHRVLKPNGRVVLLFPVCDSLAETYENDRLASRMERQLHYGHPDHKRFFGRDAEQRIARAGFDVTVFQADQEQVARHGLVRGEKVFIGRAMKANDGASTNGRARELSGAH